MVSAPVRAEGELTVAAAADLQYAMRALVQGFERQSGAHVRLVLGSSGNLTTQIEHGAPFDLFFSADVAHPAKLQQEKLIEAGSLVRYAVGQLVVYVPKNSTLDFEHHGLGVLTGPSEHKIAIANPRFAPYGRAAVAALRHAGLYETLEPRVVLGEDVSQTTQFVVSGNAQAGLTALSLMFAPGTQEHGRYWIVPASDYPPLEQAVVIVGRSREKQLAHAFLKYIKGPEGRAIFTKFGFAAPDAEKKP
ncbi:MAG: molybdate ABC transporter substrate-binding protein [Acidobacteriota bacterium]|nr:molybdate ABC transporter substrate-binding protein [Acidobacteriota bacterium]